MRDSRSNRLERPVGSILLAALLLAVAACSSPSRTDGPPKRAPVDADAVPDAVPRVEPLSPSGNPPFYEVFGERYFVLPTRTDYVERGVASWYGSAFHGNPTASGESYDMYAMTAAHKTLPLPTYARVTNLANGISIVVRINDRGPFAHNRLIDLSYTAAVKLDMIRDGTTLVEVRSLDPQSSSVDQTESSEGAVRTLYVQVGAFSNWENAKRLLDRLGTHGFTDVVVHDERLNGRRLYRVRVGPVTSVEEFDQLIDRMRQLEIHDAHLAVD